MSCATADPPAPVPHRRGWGTRLGDCILGTHPAQRFAIGITLSGLGAQLVTLVLLFYATRKGVLDPARARPLEISYVSTVVVFYVLLRSGLSRFLSDAGMALPQILAFIAWSLVGYVMLPEAHAGMLTYVSLVLVYGGFALDHAGVKIMMVSTLMLLSAVMGYVTSAHPSTYPRAVEGVYFFILMATMSLLTWFANQLADFRQRLRRQTSELGATLAQVERMATRDALTGVYNRRHMQELLAHHVRLAQRQRGGFTVALIDLDHFKQINDRHGHAVGDEVLRGFARTLEAHVPPGHAVARWGGEEFLLLAPGGDPHPVARLIDALRTHLQSAVLCAQTPGLRTNLCAGVAACGHDETLTQLVERADRALYAAKAAGRARTRVDDPHAAAPGTGGEP
jgi:diguanylate cyclase (GGDEF)-like protein